MRTRRDPGGSLVEATMLGRKDVLKIALALFAAIQVSAQAPPAGRGGGFTGRGYPAYDPAAVDRGKNAFVSSCGFCHGANAKGGESGPDLLRSVLVLDDDNGERIGPVILNGRPDKGMPKFALSATQISDIATFLHNGIRAASLHGVYPIIDIVTGDAKAGQAYFNGSGKCNTCHSVAGDLKGIGSRYDAVTLQSKFLMPRAVGTGGAEPAGKGDAQIAVKVTLASGQSFQGKLLHVDDFNVALIDSGGEYHSFEREGDTPKVEVRDPLQAHLDMLKKYTDADMHNLTAYLVTLK
jgi:cytochrome c oxidase cbb3-type subunit III